jgi:hypothetical protein
MPSQATRRGYTLKTAPGTLLIRAVTNPSTNQARRYLTSVIKWVPVCQTCVTTPFSVYLRVEMCCNRVRDRYEDEVAHTLAHATRSSRCGRTLCKRHERSNLLFWKSALIMASRYPRERAKVDRKKRRAADTTHFLFPCISSL